MGTIISKRGCGFSLSDAARERAREHLKSVGIDFDRPPKICWPEDAVYAWNRYMWDEWKYVTKEDIRRDKIVRMNRNLDFKRKSEPPARRVPMYVWVFFCPGINGIIYRGWWIYIVGMGYDCGKYVQRDEDKMSRLLDLFPLIDRPLFGLDYDSMELWKKRFVEKYQRGTWCGKPQGKAPIWVEMEGRNFIKILERAEWPSSKKNKSG